MTDTRILDTDPPWLKLAIAEIGVKEGAGSANNPRVISYYAEAKHPEVKDDGVAWCAAFTGAMLRRSGLDGTGSLLARSYRKYGHECRPVRGCIAVLERGRDPTFGHVGFYLRTVGDFIELLSGNTSDSVCVKLFPKHSVLNFRWPDEAPAHPDQVIAHEPTQSENGTSDTGQHLAAVVREQPAKSEPEKKTYEGVKDELRKNGSRTILAVDRIRGHVLKALSGLAAYISAHAAGIQSADALWPIVVTGLVVAGIAILLDVLSVEEARVDDHLNGQQERT